MKHHNYITNLLSLGMCFCIGVTIAEAQSNVKDDEIAMAIDSQNYSLAETLAARRTYPGTLVNTTKVCVRVFSPRGGLVTGIPASIANGVFGMRIGERKVDANEYVIRLDTPDGASAAIITVVQGGEMIAPGTPVFVVAGDSHCSGRYRGFRVRVIEAKTPEHYGDEGLEEARQNGRAVEKGR